MTEDFNNNNDVYFDFSDDEEDIIELTDEDGIVERFQYIATIPYEGEEYVLLTNAMDEEQDDEDYAEVVVLKIEQDENGEDIYVSCDEEDTRQAVFDLFQQLLEEEDED
ncbi:MAG: DUF1292 domain-containing protein [Eubacteriales bacterium]|nr:DUF1292 domain-containing protein [Eubacteriales bacterium]